MPSLLWSSALLPAVALGAAAAALARDLLRRAGRRRAGGGGPPPADVIEADRIEVELRALEWMRREGRIGAGDYLRARERLLGG